MVIFFLVSILVVGLIASLYLERIGWGEAAVWVLVAIGLGVILWPKPAEDDPGWIGLMVGLGILDAAFLFRAALASVRGGFTLR